MTQYKGIQLPFPDMMERLRAKAWQSSNRRKASGNVGSSAYEHICYWAAEKIEELTRGKDGAIPVRSVREIFSRRLNLHYDQRAYSWHEIQAALEEVDQARTE